MGIFILRSLNDETKEFRIAYWMSIYRIHSQILKYKSIRRRSIRRTDNTVLSIKRKGKGRQVNAFFVASSNFSCWLSSTQYTAHPSRKLKEAVGTDMKFKRKFSLTCTIRTWSLQRNILMQNWSKNYQHEQEVKKLLTR